MQLKRTCILYTLTSFTNKIQFFIMSFSMFVIFHDFSMFRGNPVLCNAARVLGTVPALNGQNELFYI